MNSAERVKNPTATQRAAYWRRVAEKLLELVPFEDRMQTPHESVEQFYALQEKEDRVWTR